MRVKTLNIIYCIVLLVFVIFLYWTSFGEAVSGRPISRDPVWFPRLLLILILVVIAILFTSSLLDRSGKMITAIRWQPLAATILGTGLYLAIFQSIGFIISTVLLTSIMSWFLGFRRPVAIIAIAIGFTLFVWYGFNDLLNVTPPGLILPSLR